MGNTTIVAMALRYPEPGALDRLGAAVATMSDDDTKHSMEKFVAAIRKLDLSEWEELHTDTVDLSPSFVPYVGHAVWGENYRRGAFMADLARAMSETGTSLDGELPDHLEPILRYLDTVDDPIGDLVEVLPMAIMRMTKELRDADRKNPYRHVLAAAAAAVARLVDGLRKASA